MKFINYTNDGRVVVQHAALILSKLDETDTLELHTMDNAIILLKKDMTLVETRDVLQGMVRLARSMTLDALCNADAEDKTPLVDESVDDEYEDMVLHVSPRELSDSLFSRLTAAPGSIRADINETTRRKKAGFLRREITEAQAVLAASGRADRFPMVCFTSLLCFALGACIAIAAGNAFLVPVLAVGLMLTPFWYVKLTAGSFKKDVAAELETALSVITTAYLRNENFQQAVEENVRYLHPPVQEVFQHFLMRIKHIDPDMDAALTDLKAAIDNEVWREWCDAVMACQTDRSLTSILTPIVSKLSDMRVVNAELDNLVFGPRKEFITMAILVLINIPLVRFINKDWYHTLVATIPGQMVIAVCLAAVFVSFAFVVKLTQPIEYRR